MTMPRTRLWLLFLSVGAGVALALAAPPSWNVAPFHGVLFGSAFYICALKRPGGELWRAGVFLALAVTQAYVLFETTPGADVRATFVILSTWIVLESVGKARTAPAGGRG
jgi:hypothetical protein